MEIVLLAAIGLNIGITCWVLRALLTLGREEFSLGENVTDMAKARPNAVSEASIPVQQIDMAPEPTLAEILAPGKKHHRHSWRYYSREETGGKKILIYTCETCGDWEKREEVA